MAFERNITSFVFIFKGRLDPQVFYQRLNPLNIDADLLISINHVIFLKVEIISTQDVAV